MDWSVPMAAEAQGCSSATGDKWIRRVLRPPSLPYAEPTLESRRELLDVITPTRTSTTGETPAPTQAPPAKKRGTLTWVMIAKMLRNRRAKDPGHRVRSSTPRPRVGRHRGPVAHDGRTPLMLRRDRERWATGGLRPMLPGSGRAR